MIWSRTCAATVCGAAMLSASGALADDGTGSMSGMRMMAGALGGYSLVTSAW